MCSRRDDVWFGTGSCTVLVWFMLATNLAATSLPVAAKRSYARSILALYGEYQCQASKFLRSLEQRVLRCGGKARLLSLAPIVIQFFARPS